MTTLPERAGRRCYFFLNSLHSTIYFAPELAKDLAERGIGDPMGGYLVSRAAALGPVEPGVVTAVFHGFKHEMIAQHLPVAWKLAPPETVVDARFRAADSMLRRLLGDEAIASPDMREAARLALRACDGCLRAARPMYAAHADLTVPDQPHLALWYAATLLREHRGDGHFTVLTVFEIDGLEALVSHSATSDGIPKDMVMTKRGWTEEDWSAAEQRLAQRGFMDADGRLTAKGIRMRAELEDETDRLDRRPYEHLGAEGVARLTELGARFTAAAAAAGGFPPPVVEFFTRG